MGQDIADVLGGSPRLARNPRGWNASMLARKSSTVSRGIVLENIVGSNAATNASGAPSANVSA